MMDRILGLTSPNNQVSLTTKKRSAKGMVSPPKGRKGIRLPWCPPNSERFIYSAFTKDTLDEKGQARDTKVHVTL